MKKEWDCGSCKLCAKVETPSFWVLFGRCWSKYGVFAGRASRKEFWGFVLLNAVAAAILGRIEGTIALIYSLATLLPTISVGVRRFHDIGKSGWAYFGFQAAYAVYFALFPVVGWATKPRTGLPPGAVALWENIGLGLVFVFLATALCFIVLTARRGNQGGNRFGPPPTRRGEHCQMAETPAQ